LELSFESTTGVTQPEFAAWWREIDGRDPNFYELLNGRVVMTPPAGYPHGSIEINVGSLVATFVKERRLGKVFGPSQGFELPSGDTVGPDCSYVSNARWTAAPPPEMGKYLRVVPDLAVEILSISTASRDRGEKKAIYERNGVREYWLVDPRAGCLTVFTAATSGRFENAQTFDDDAVFTSSVLSGLDVVVASLFD
jgi:Uma2 family endonuclease